MNKNGKLVLSTTLAFAGGFFSALMLSSNTGKRTFRQLAQSSQLVGERVRHAVESSYSPEFKGGWALNDSDVLLNLGNALR